MTNRNGLPCFAERGPVITTFCLSPDRHEAAQGKQHPYPKLVRCLGKSSREAKRLTARACQSQGAVPELMSRQVLLTLRAVLGSCPSHILLWLWLVPVPLGLLCWAGPCCQKVLLAPRCAPQVSSQGELHPMHLHSTYSILPKRPPLVIFSPTPHTCRTKPGKTTILAPLPKMQSFV